MKKADLHVHTTASDGRFTPKEAIDWAYKKKLDVIGITDHDTVNGIMPAIERAKIYDNLKVIPGIEISSDYGNEEVHILGYHINFMSTTLLKFTKEFKESRILRGMKIVSNLKELGINISIEEVKAISPRDFIGRPHIARVLLSKRYVKSIEEAFERYLNRNCSAYVERFKLPVKDSIDLIHRSGGVAILAHPGLLASDKAISYSVECNIDGIEVFHSKHSKEDVMRLTKIADNYDFIKTGGSDCHGNLFNNSPIIGDYYVNSNIVNTLFNKSLKYNKGVPNE